MRKLRRPQWILIALYSFTSLVGVALTITLVADFKGEGGGGDVVIPSISYSIDNSNDNMYAGEEDSTTKIEIQSIDGADLSKLSVDVGDTGLSWVVNSVKGVITILANEATSGNKTITVSCEGCNDLQVNLFVGKVISNDHLLITNNVLKGFDGTYDISWGTKVVVLPNTATSIDANAFSGNKDLTWIDLNVISGNIGDGAFSLCSGVKGIDLGGMTTGSIGSQAFGRCASLTANNITLPTSEFGPAGQKYKVIDTLKGKAVLNSTASTVMGCLAVGDLTWGDLNNEGVSAIGNTFFLFCASLISIDLRGMTTQSIGNSAFSGCSGLRNVNISEMTTGSIGSGAFGGCGNLKAYSIILPNGEFGPGGQKYKIVDTLKGKAVMNSQGNAVIGCLAAGDFTWEEFKSVGSTAIANNGFSSCASIISFDLSGITNETIGQGAFGSCVNLTKVDLGGPNAKLEYYEFQQCSNLIDITFRYNQTPTNASNSFFSNISTIGTFHALGNWNVQDEVISWISGKNSGMDFSQWTVSPT